MKALPAVVTSSYDFENVGEAVEEQGAEEVVVPIGG